MVADIRMIDYFANKKDSPFHVASAISKVVATILIIMSIVVNTEMPSLVLILGVILFAARLSRIPLRRMLRWGVYPVVFAAIFAIGVFVRDLPSLGFAGATYLPIVLILRSLCAALSLILLLSTTPYTQIFGFGRRLLPELVVGTMLLTYRFFFILMDELDNLIRAMRLKGGGLSAGRIIENIGNYGRIVGVLLIHSVDMSERMYKILLVRGYRGAFSMGEETRWRRSDVYPLSIGLLVMGISLQSRGVI